MVLRFGRRPARAGAGALRHADRRGRLALLLLRPRRLEHHAAEVKSLESALTVRSRILAAFEAAELERDPERRGEWLTFVVVGAGPTGVEMAGQIAELARDTLRSDFRSADPGSGRILLVETADRVLTGFPPSLSAKAEHSLRRLGVTPVLDSTVVDVDETASRSSTRTARRGASRREPSSGLPA